MTFLVWSTLLSLIFLAAAITSILLPAALLADDKLVAHEAGAVVTAAVIIILLSALIPTYSGFGAAILYLKKVITFREMKQSLLLLLFSASFFVVTLLCRGESFSILPLLTVFFLVKLLDMSSSILRVIDDHYPQLIHENSAAIVYYQLFLQAGSYSSLFIYLLDLDYDPVLLLTTGAVLLGACGIGIYFYFQWLQRCSFNKQSTVYAFYSILWVSGVETSLLILFVSGAIHSFALFGLLYLASCAVGMLLGVVAMSAELFTILRAMKNSEAVKRTFLNYISHEIRGPLSNAIMGLDLLEGLFAKNKHDGERIDSAYVVDLISDVKIATGIACVTFNDILALDKLNNSTELSLEIVRVVDFVANCIKPFRLQASTLKVLLNLKNEMSELDSSTAGVEIDKFKIQQALRNFVTNAIKFTAGGRVDIVVSKRDRFAAFTPAADVVELARARETAAAAAAGSRVTNLVTYVPAVQKNRANILTGLIVSSTKQQKRSAFHWLSGRALPHASQSRRRPSNTAPDDFAAALASLSHRSLLRSEVVRISVIDSGVGLSAENMVKMFQEYSQIDADKLQQGKGSGLGLWLSKLLVEAQGGRVGVSSEGGGKGCEFFIELPLKAMSQPPPLTDGGNEASPRSPKSPRSPRSAVILSRLVSRMQTAFVPQQQRSFVPRSSPAASSKKGRLTHARSLPSISMQSFRRSEAGSGSLAAGVPKLKQVFPAGIPEEASLSPASIDPQRSPPHFAVDIDPVPVLTNAHVQVINHKQERPAGTALDALQQQRTVATSLVTTQNRASLSLQEEHRLLPSPSRPPHRLFRMLIVDDSNLTRKMVVRTLHPLISSCEEASSGIEAVRKVTQSHFPATSVLAVVGDTEVPAPLAPYDVVLIDHSMPGELSGPAAAAAIRKAGYSGFLFGLTASDDEEHWEEFTKAGADACILKPVNVALLSSLLLCNDKEDDSREPPLNF